MRAFPPARGWRLWLAIAVGLVVVLRVAAPLAIRVGIESQGTKALGVPVRLADVDLWVLLGGIQLEDLRIRTMPPRSPAGSRPPGVVVTLAATPAP